MKQNRNKKALTLLVCLVMLITVAVGGTLAYLIASTQPVKNEFAPSKVSCAVVEDPFDGTKKTNVQIRNTGDTKAYIRAAVVVTWKNDKGEIHASTPMEGTDYEIVFNLSDGGWIKGSDGFFYYANEVAPCTHAEGQEHTGCTTGVLISSCSPVDGHAPNEHYLSVEIIASAIQSSPDMVVEEQWSTGVSDANNGKLTIQKGEST